MNDTLPIRGFSDSGYGWKVDWYFNRELHKTCKLQYERIIY